MQNIYIVVSSSGSLVSKAIGLATDKEYNHCSFSFDPFISHMYSMGRIYPNNPVIGGLVLELPNYGTYSKFKDTRCIVIQVPVNDEQYFLMKNEIIRMSTNLKEYHYNVAGLLLGRFGVKIERDNYFMCTEFVRHVLEVGRFDINFLPEIPHPMDYLAIPNGKVIYTGYFNQLGDANVLNANYGYLNWQ